MLNLFIQFNLKILCKQFSTCISLNATVYYLKKIPDEELYCFSYLAAPIYKDICLTNKLPKYTCIVETREKIK